MALNTKIDERWGWTMFAAVGLVTAALFNIMYGLVMLIEPDWVGFRAEELYIANLTTFGWLLLIVAAAQIVAAVGVFWFHSWGRILGLVSAIANAVVLFPVIPLFPVYGLLIIFLDIVLIFALASKWVESDTNIRA